jgi:2-methylaconitate cis-trans-isomerase PrpF
VSQLRIPAVFVRGGTSKAIVFRAEDLPPDREERERIFLSALGSPDPHGRQLDGMDGGLSSLSKVAVVGPPSRGDADVDYTFHQVAIDRPFVDMSGNCGNISAAIGPFARQSGLAALRLADAEALVRIHNTNTGRIIESRFPVDAGGMPMESGDFALPGVAGTGARIRLDYLGPGGAVTGRLLPTGSVVERLAFAGGEVEASLIDATNPCIFVAASDVGLQADADPAAIDADRALVGRLLSLRAEACRCMGLVASADDADRDSPANPRILMLSSPPVPTHADIQVRMLSMGQAHRAIAMTSAMCLAVAALIEGTVAARLVARVPTGTRPLRIQHAGGVVAVGAVVRRDPWHAVSVFTERTARRLMEGFVLVPSVTP